MMMIRAVTPVASKGQGHQLEHVKRLKKEGEFTGSTEIMELVESPKPSRKSPKTKVSVVPTQMHSMKLAIILL